MFEDMGSRFNSCLSVLLQVICRRMFWKINKDHRVVLEFENSCAFWITSGQFEPVLGYIFRSSSRQLARDINQNVCRGSEKI